MFTVAAAQEPFSFCVRLQHHVSLDDLNYGAAALECEQRLNRLTSPSTILADLSELRDVEPEAQGALLFLLGQALRRPDVEVVMVAPPSLQRQLRRTYARRLLRHGRLHLVPSLCQAPLPARHLS